MDQRIASIRIHHLEADLDERFGWSLNWTRRRSVTLVEVRTEDGLVGWGEGRVEGAERALGRSAWEVAGIWESSRAPSENQRRRGPAAGAAVDIALWDIVGKACGKPVCELLGEVYRRRVEGYCTALYRKDWPDWGEGLAEEALGWRQKGFRNIKMKIGFDPDTDVRLVARVREAIGPSVGLAVDSNCAYDAGTAAQLASRLEPLELLWWEEPLLADDLEGYDRLRAGTRIPLAAGETETAEWLIENYVAPRRVAILQPDLVNTGLTGFRQLNHLCWLKRVRLIPHNWGTALRTAATLHAMATCPPLTEALNPPQVMLEFDRTENPLRDAILAEKLDIDPSDSCLPVPQGPGLGVEVLPAEVARFRVQLEELS